MILEFLYRIGGNTTLLELVPVRYGISFSYPEALHDRGIRTRDLIKDRMVLHVADRDLTEEAVRQVNEVTGSEPVIGF